jgi:hypothetical protein
VVFDAQTSAASRFFSLDDVEASQVFLGLGEGAVGCHEIAVSHAYDRGGFRFEQPAGEDQGATGLHLLLEDEDLLPGPLHLLLGHLGASFAVDAVGGKHVLGHGGLSFGSGGLVPPLTLTTSVKRPK